MPSRPRRPTGPAVVLLSAVLAVLLGVTVLSGVPAGATSGATSGARSGATSGARSEEPGRGERLRGSRFSVVDHNVQMRPAALAEALERAVRTKAPAVLLQEVCWWQVRDIREAHPDWTVAYKRGVDAAPCRRPFELGGLADRDREDSGVVAIWTGGASGAVSTYTYRAQSRRKVRRAGERHLNDGVACVRWRATGTVRHACSTHLVNASKFRSRRPTQVRQARELRRLTGPWVRSGDLVVLGGDFNAAPQSRTMDFLYDVDGRGSFHEATGCPRAVEVCRRSLGASVDGAKTQIDYVFFSANRVITSAPRRLAILPTNSDHHLLSAWAWVDLT